MFAQRTLVLSHPNKSQPGLSLPRWQSSHNQFGEATNRRSIRWETATVRPKLILDTVVRKPSFRLCKPLEPRPTGITEAEELT
jgi:hypothetical protein